MEGIISVGRVTSAHGIRGEFYIRLFSKENPWLSGLKTLTLNLHSETLKLDIIKMRTHKDGFIVLCKQYTDRTEAQKLRGAELVLPENIFTSKAGERLYLREVLGFQVFNDQDRVGVIDGFSSNTVQDLLIIKSQDKKFQVPFIEEFISRIDFEKKEVHMLLPEGLLEVSIEV